MIKAHTDGPDTHIEVKFKDVNGPVVETLRLIRGIYKSMDEYSTEMAEDYYTKLIFMLMTNHRLITNDESLDEDDQEVIRLRTAKE